jgi:hypothetical protein
VASCFPFQIFDDGLYHDLENKEVLEEPLDALIPACYNKYDDLVDYIDEFIHVGIHKRDVIGHNEDLIYDIEGHIQLLPLQQPYVITTDFDAINKEMA